MEPEKRLPELRMLVSISAPKLADKAAVLFQKGHIPIVYQFCAQGTASSEMMELLGLGSIEKTVLLSILPRPFAGEMLKKLKKQLHLGTSNSGIAFTMALSGCSSRMIDAVRYLEEAQKETLFPAITNPKRELNTMSDTRYVMILAVINQGFGQEVMTAARSAGASGGTGFHVRHLVNEETAKFWGLGVQQEREVISIVAPEEEKLPLMKAISESCGLHSEAKGIVLSLPVDQVIGLD